LIAVRKSAYRTTGADNRDRGAYLFWGLGRFAGSRLINPCSRLGASFCRRCYGATVCGLIWRSTAVGLRFSCPRRRPRCQR